MRLYLLMVLLLAAALAGCGARHQLRVENGYPFPVEVLSGSIGGRLSRQADPIGTVPARGTATFDGSHPFLSPETSLTITTQDGRVLADIRPGASAPAYQMAHTGRNSMETLRVGPPTR